MPSAHSLHIALNHLDPAHYPALAPLRGPVNDAVLMERLTREVWGYLSATRLYNEQATAEAVLNTLRHFADALEAGDLLLVTYSGHGGLVYDPHWQERGEDEAYDQTWCLYNRQLLDDELHEAFSRFKTGVQIAVVSDSCHSGTVTRRLTDLSPEESALQERGFTRKALEPKDLNSIYERFGQLYNGITEKFRNKQRTDQDIAARVILFAACQDHESAFDGPEHGCFTLALKKVLDEPGAAQYNAETLFNRIRWAYTYPQPNLLYQGTPNPDFEQRFPFSLLPVGSANAVPISPGTADQPLMAPPVAAPPPKPEQFQLSVLCEEGHLSERQIRAIFTPGLRFYAYSTTSNLLRITLDSSAFNTEWSAIHAATARAQGLGISLFIEPAVTMGSDVVFIPFGTKTVTDESGFLPQWPPVSNGVSLPLGWHLNEDYSQLGPARDRVWEGIRNGTRKPIRVAQLDTGYDRYHPAFQRESYIQHDLARSFLHYEGHAGNTGALDVYYGSGEVQGHGTGTLALMAGGYVSNHWMHGDYQGYLGGIPFAHVIPMRISETVVIFDSAQFCAALEYAMQLKCEVVTMSMAGKPSVQMAKMINQAYEAGITIVSAAGNSWTKGALKNSPKTVLYPARFPRVIAACGVCQNHLPYDFDAQAQFARKGADPFDVMQGNWGPDAAMQKALAAYTPNIPWAITKKDARGRLITPFSKGGSGTSVATPQIAAAAALWIMEHRAELDDKGYSGTWKQVEAVRHALFTSADTQRFEHSKKYYGNGILQANKALDVPCVDIADDQKSPECESSWGGISELANLLFRRRREVATPNSSRETALALELQYVLFSDPQLLSLSEQLDLSTPLNADTQNQLEQALRQSGYLSAELRGMLQG